MISIFMPLLGLLGGIVLSFLAAEESKQGKKYFLFLQRILYWAVSFSILVAFFFEKRYPFLAAFIIFALLFFWLSHTSAHKFLLLLPYTIFITALFFISNQDAFLMAASLLFLYGIPVGTLLIHGKEEKS